MTRFIICKHCNLRLKLTNNVMPSNCPRCENKFRRNFDSSVITAMVEAVVGKTDRGYYEADALGFVKGKELKFPQERKYNELY